MENVNRDTPYSEGQSISHDKYTESYIGILDQYKEQITSYTTAKNKLKERSFILIATIMSVLIFIFCIVVVISFVLFFNMLKSRSDSIAVIVGAVTAIVSSFATMVVSMFKMPEIITKYLFNKDEDKQMTTIIQNIQSYEIAFLKQETERIKLAQSMSSGLSGNISSPDSHNANNGLDVDDFSDDTELHDDNSTIDEVKQDVDSDISTNTDGNEFSSTGSDQTIEDTTIAGENNI